MRCAWPIGVRSASAWAAPRTRDMSSDLAFPIFSTRAVAAARSVSVSRVRSVPASSASVAFGSAAMPSEIGWLRPISQGSSSICTTRRPRGNGVPSVWRNQVKTFAPTIKSASQSSSAFRTPPGDGKRPPRHSAWFPGKFVRRKTGSPWTRAPSSSASAVSSGTACDRATPSPAMMMGAWAPVRSSTARARAPGSGRERAAIAVGPAPVSSTAGLMRSIGNERNTGPVGGVSAILSARRSATGASSARRISYDHLVNCSAIWTRSPARIGSSMRNRESCCPAVTTSGVLARAALWRIERLFARPGATWTLTTPIWPDACAYPSAAATAVASCSPSTYSSPESGSASRKGSSVVPGFPKR